MSINLYLKPVNLLLFLLILLISCGFPVGCREKMPEEYERVLSQPLKKQSAEFVKLPIEKQYGLYIYVMAKRHPPESSFARDIAKQGEKVVPFLMNKLKEEKNDYIRQCIILIFHRMAKHHPSIKDNNELIGLIKEVISSMEDPFWVEMSKKFLEEIINK